MSDAWRRKLKEQFSGMARRPLRCLALAVKDTQLGALAGMREDQPPSRAAAAVLQATWLGLGLGLGLPLSLTLSPTLSLTYRRCCRRRAASTRSSAASPSRAWWASRTLTLTLTLTLTNPNPP